MVDGYVAWVGMALTIGTVIAVVATYLSSKASVGSLSRLAARVRHLELWAASKGFSDIHLTSEEENDL